MHVSLLYSLEEALKFASASAAGTGVLRLGYAQASRAASVFCVGFAVNSRALLKKSLSLLARFSKILCIFYRYTVSR